MSPFYSTILWASLLKKLDVEFNFLELIVIRRWDTSIIPGTKPEKRSKHIYLKSDYSAQNLPLTHTQRNC